MYGNILHKKGSVQTEQEFCVNMPKRKMNPRRIPLAKSAINKDTIVEEAMKDDMYHGWLLVATALVDLEFARPEEIQSICDQVNLFAKKDAAKDAMDRADKLMGIGSKPRLNIDRVTSPVELMKFKKKVKRIALHTSLAVICLGLESLGKYSGEDLHRIFLSADLTQAEIDAGTESYDELERQLLNQMVTIELDSEM